MPPRFESTEVTRLQRSRTRLAFPLVVLLASALSLFSTLQHHPLTSLVTTFVIVLAAIGSRLPGVQALTVRRIHRGTVAIGAQGIAWNGATILPRERIRDGVLLPATVNGPVVRVGVRGLPGAMPVELGVRDAAQGREVLRALGFDATQVTASFRGRSRLATGVVPVGAFVAGAGVFIGTLGALGGSTILAPVLMPLILAAMVALFVAPTRVTVGTDGVLTTWLGSRRFVPYGRVARVETTETTVDLVCRDGAVVRLPLGAPQGRRMHNRGDRVHLARAERDALAERIRDAMAAEPSDAPVLDRGALARGERSAGEWLTHLRTLANRSEGGMRSAPVLREQLIACVHDATAEPDARAGAAAALAASDDPASRETLRVAARAVASPRLRVVFEAAADGDDSDALERALARVDADTHRAR